MATITFCDVCKKEIKDKNNQYWIQIRKSYEFTPGIDLKPLPCTTADICYTCATKIYNFMSNPKKDKTL